MPKLTPQEGADKLITRLSAAGEDIRKGIDRVTESPTKKAAASIKKMRQNILKAIDDGKVERGLNKVDLQAWKDAAINKGVDRIGPGIEAARSKIIANNEKMYPFIDGVVAEVNKIPHMTIDDSVRRSETMIRGMSKYQK